jgi:hypothetical protein
MTNDDLTPKETGADPRKWKSQVEPNP